MLVTLKGSRVRAKRLQRARIQICAFTHSVKCDHDVRLLKSFPQYKKPLRVISVGFQY